MMYSHQQSLNFYECDSSLIVVQYFPDIFHLLLLQQVYTVYYAVSYTHLDVYKRQQLVYDQYLNVCVKL